MNSFEFTDLPETPSPFDPVPLTSQPVAVLHLVFSCKSGTPPIGR